MTEPTSLRRLLAPLGRRLLARRLPSPRIGGLKLAHDVTERHGRPSSIDDATRLARPRVVMAGLSRSVPGRVTRTRAPEPQAALPRIPRVPGVSEAAARWLFNVQGPVEWVEPPPRAKSAADAVASSPDNPGGVAVPRSHVEEVSRFRVSRTPAEKPVSRAPAGKPEAPPPGRVEPASSASPPAKPKARESTRSGGRRLDRKPAAPSAPSAPSAASAPSAPSKAAPPPPAAPDQAMTEPAAGSPEPDSPPRPESPRTATPAPQPAQPVKLLRKPRHDRPAAARAVVRQASSRPKAEPASAPARLPTAPAVARKPSLMRRALERVSPRRPAAVPAPPSATPP